MVFLTIIVTGQSKTDRTGGASAPPRHLTAGFFSGIRYIGAFEP
jgi:hypothetical protein